MRRRLRRLRFALVGTLSTLIILAAVVVGVARLALPWLAQHPERVERWLSERLGRHVSISKVETLWTRSGPRLVLGDLGIAAGDNGEPAFNLARAEIAVNLYAAFERNRAWNEFRLVGLDLALVREADGAWRVRGFDTGGSGDSMGALGAIVLVDLKLNVIDTERDIELDFAVPELRVVNLGRITRVLGRIGAVSTTAPPFSVVADIDVDARSGQLYLGGRGLDLAQISGEQSIGGLSVPGGNGDIEVWASWQAGKLDAIRTRLDLRETTLAATTTVAVEPSVAVAPRTFFERLAFVGRWQRDDNDWVLDIADAAVTRRGESREGGRVHVERSGGDAARYRVDASGVELEPLGSVGMLVDRLPAGLRRWLYLGNPHGTLVAGELDWTSADDFSVDAVLDRAGTRSAGAIPGIAPLHARLRGDAQSLLLEIPKQASRFEFPRAFGKPFDFSGFGGDIVAWHDDGAWRVQTEQFIVEGADYALDIRGGIELQDDGSRPLFDLYVLVPHAQVTAAKQFWTLNSMSRKTVDWLDRALLGGRIAEGRVVFRGDLDDWPFRDNEGRFEARADLEGLDLAYLPDWPHGEKIDVVAHFINNGMQAIVSKGSALALSIDSAEATIANYAESVLDFNATSHGSGAELLDFLRATPIGKNNAEALDGLRIGGEGKLDVALNVPLKTNEALVLDGRVELANASISEKDWGLEFERANGEVHFTRGGVSAPALAVHIDGRPATLGIAIGSATAETANSLEASLHAVLPVATVFARAPDLAPAFSRFPGEAQWNIGLAIGSAKASAPGHKTLHIASDLRGITIDLPEPLAKAGDTRLPFALTLEIPPLGKPFTATLGDAIRVHGRFPHAGTALAARLDFGSQLATGALPASGILIGGHAHALDAGGWMNLLGGNSGAGQMFQGLALDVGDLQLAGRHFADTRVEITPAPALTTITLAGSAIEGELSVPFADLARSGITAQMKRLHWPDAPSGEENATDMLARIAPASIPPLHIWVGELRLGSSNFGEARFESFPTADGMHIDRLETESPNVDMRASGDWTGSAGDNRSHLVIDMTAQDLGRMLDALGFSGVIDGGQTLARIDASWPGAPGAFALANVAGTLDISVDKGRILDVDPGAGGRLFGLLSLREIPRRLTLDFSDLFKSGMSFNAISGKFTLRDGNAFTEDLKINSPAADINISGRTGLRSKDYDQQMVVTPRAGVTLPVVGALAGGPVGAAAGLVVQGLLGKQINQVARSRYQVSGSWEKPAITLLGREKPTAAPKVPDGDLKSPPAKDG